MLPYFVVFAVSAGVTFIATPLVRQLALRVGWIDHPSDRKVHPKPTPTAGGLAIFFGVVAALLVTRALPALGDLRETTSELDAAIVAAVVIVLGGLIDHTRGLSAPSKLAGAGRGAGAPALGG